MHGKTTIKKNESGLFLGTSEITSPVTKLGIPEDLNPK
jgi:hypothetical protein